MERRIYQIIYVLFALASAGFTDCDEKPEKPSDERPDPVTRPQGAWTVRFEGYTDCLEQPQSVTVGAINEDAETPSVYVTDGQDGITQVRCGLTEASTDFPTIWDVHAFGRTWVEPVIPINDIESETGPGGDMEIEVSFSSADAYSKDPSDPAIGSFRYSFSNFGEPFLWGREYVDAECAFSWLYTDIYEWFNVEYNCAATASVIDPPPPTSICRIRGQMQFDHCATQ